MAHSARSRGNCLCLSRAWRAREGCPLIGFCVPGEDIKAEAEGLLLNGSRVRGKGRDMKAEVGGGVTPPCRIRQCPLSSISISTHCGAQPEAETNIVHDGFSSCLMATISTSQRGSRRLPRPTIPERGRSAGSGKPGKPPTWGDPGRDQPACLQPGLPSITPWAADWRNSAPNGWTAIMGRRCLWDVAAAPGCVSLGDRSTLTLVLPRISPDRPSSSRPPCISATISIALSLHLLEAFVPDNHPLVWIPFRLAPRPTASWSDLRNHSPTPTIVSPASPRRQVRKPATSGSRAPVPLR